MIETIGTTVWLKTDYDSALEKVTAALQLEGFGVLTRIDVQETFKKKLGIDFRRYTILGACNPNLSHQALTLAPEVGLLLPCNITVAEGEDGRIEVSLVDPMAMLGVLRNPALEPIAQEARERLERVAASLQDT